MSLLHRFLRQYVIVTMQWPSSVIVNLAVIRRGQGKMQLTVWGEGQQAGTGQGRVSKDGHTFGKPHIFRRASDRWDRRRRGSAA